MVPEEVWSSILAAQVKLSGRRKLTRAACGTLSEPIEQLHLVLEDLEITRSAERSDLVLVDVHKTRSVRKALPDQLPRQELVLDPRVARTACGGRRSSASAKTSPKSLSMYPGRFVVNPFIRHRMACACCEHFQQAPLPSRPIERGRPWPGLISSAVISGTRKGVSAIGSTSSSPRAMRRQVLTCCGRRP